MYEDKEKYKSINNKEVLNRLLLAIICQAIKDINQEKDQYAKQESLCFIKSEYCELICYVAKREYSMLLKIAIDTY